MPTSQHYQVSKILDLLVQLNPQSILDIGTGFGKYGLLSREYLELWSPEEKYGTFQRIVDGIEIFEGYLTPVHKYVYNKVYIGNASNVVKTLTTRYELTLLIDVLEHFEKDAGACLIQDIFKISKNLIISVPKDLGDQGTTFENEYEKHLTQWTAPELLQMAPGNGFSISDRMSHIVFLSIESDLARLKRVFNPSILVKAKRAFSEIVRK